MAEQYDELETKQYSWQKTIIITFAVCESLAVCMIMTNISNYQEQRVLVFCGILAIAILIMITWVIAFIGTVNESSSLVNFAYLMWVFIGVVWFFFLTGCINPTRCPESLWLFDNSDRTEHLDDSKEDFYYHYDHRSFADKPPKGMANAVEREHGDYADVPYHEHLVPLIKFFRLYVAWRSATGAVVFFVSFASVLLFFIATTTTLKSYANYLSARQKRRHMKAVCTC